MLFKGLKRGLSLFSSTIYRGHSRSQTPSVTLGIQISLLEHQSTNDANRQNSVKNSPRTGTTSKTTVQNRIVGGCERQGGRRSEAPSDARTRNKRQLHRQEEDPPGPVHHRSTWPSPAQDRPRGSSVRLLLLQRCLCLSCVSRVAEPHHSFVARVGTFFSVSNESAYLFRRPGGGYCGYLGVVVWDRVGGYIAIKRWRPEVGWRYG